MQAAQNQMHVQTRTTEQTLGGREKDGDSHDNFGSEIGHVMFMFIFMHMGVEREGGYANADA